MKKFNIFYLVGFFVFLQCFFSTASKAHIVVTIKPLHSIVSNLTKNTTINTALLIKETASPHDFHLKPSHIRLVRNADLVIYIDEHFETFLPKVLAAHSNPSAGFKITDHIRRHMIAVRGEFGCGCCFKEEEHGHHHEHHGHKHAHSHDTELDFHFWMDPKVVSFFAEVVTQKLSVLYPTEKEMLQQNLADLKVKLEKLDTLLKYRLSGLEDKPMVVFHDAYQYYEKAYGIQIVDVISPKVHISPSAKHISALRKKVKNFDVQCVLSEPQFENNWIKTVTEGMDVGVSEIDPLGANRLPGEAQYFLMMQDIAKQILECQK